jgi:hypothetical protein
MEYVKQIMKYLYGTRDHCLKYQGPAEVELTAYVDASYASEPSDRRGTTGFVILMANAAVSWCAKKQDCNTLSSAEAEYVALCSATKEIVWLRQVLNELGFEQLKPTTVYCDNQAAIHMANDNILNERSKHIDIRYHYTRKAIEAKQITLKYVRSADNHADLFTKPLGQNLLHKHSQAIGLTTADQGVCQN